MPRKLSIICPLHGEFLQIPWVHLQGSGCPACAAGAHPGGYNQKLFDRRPELKDFPARLYLVVLSNETDGYFIKHGITTVSTKQRLAGLNVVDILLEIDTQLYSAFISEQNTLKTFKKYKFKPTQKFGGWTECFKLDAKQEILEHILNT